MAEGVAVDGVGRIGIEVHVEILLDIGRPVDFFGKGRGAGIIVLKGRRIVGFDQILALGIIDIRYEVKIGFGMFERPAVIEIAGHAIGAVEVDVGGAVAAFDGGGDSVLDIVDRSTGIEGSEQYMVIRRIEGLV